MRRDTLITMGPWLVCVVLVACVSCGKKSSSALHSEAGVPPKAWRFVEFVHAPRNQLAVVVSDKEAALVTPDGKLTQPIKTSSEAIGAVGNGELTVLQEGETLHGLDRTGHVRWEQTFASAKAAMGSSTTAIASGQKSVILDLATGTASYEGSPAKRVFYHHDDGYTFISDSEVWFVDEATSKERWRNRVADMADAAISQDKSLLVIRADRSFEEYDCASGKSLAKGTCPGLSPQEGEHAKALPCAGEPPTDSKRNETSSLLSRGDDGDYYVLFKRGAATRLLARDLVGRTRWTVTWPAASTNLKTPPIHDTRSTSIAFIAGRPEARTLVVFDESDGRLGFQRSLDIRDHVAGFAGSCLLIVTSKSVVCVDKDSGNDAWSWLTTGDKVDAWPVGEADTLIISGIPLGLTRVGKDGHTQWQIELPGTDLQRTDPYAAATLAEGSNVWRFSDVVGVVEASKGLRVIDLVHGKVSEVQ